ncbi:MAG: hypothetical protein ABSC94_27135 [Polyangiaceae bacterium]|jgi:hypothetical protein
MRRIRVEFRKKKSGTGSWEVRVKRERPPDEDWRPFQEGGADLFWKIFTDDHEELLAEPCHVCLEPENGLLAYASLDSFPSETWASLWTARHPKTDMLLLDEGWALQQVTFASRLVRWSESVGVIGSGLKALQSAFGRVFDAKLPNAQWRHSLLVVTDAVSPKEARAFQEKAVTDESAMIVWLNASPTTLAKGVHEVVTSPSDVPGGASDPQRAHRWLGRLLESLTEEKDTPARAFARSLAAADNDDRRKRWFRGGLGSWLVARRSSPAATRLPIDWKTRVDRTLHEGYLSNAIHTFPVRKVLMLVTPGTMLSGLHYFVRRRIANSEVRIVPRDIEWSEEFCRTTQRLPAAVGASDVDDLSRSLQQLLGSGVTPAVLWVSHPPTVLKLVQEAPDGFRRVSIDDLRAYRDELWQLATRLGEGGRIVVHVAVATAGDATVLRELKQGVPNVGSPFKVIVLPPMAPTVGRDDLEVWLERHDLSLPTDVEQPPLDSYDQLIEWIEGHVSRLRS